ncbi:MAG: cytidylate kinase-like family protein [Coprococcus sp.]|nr:cytidylate kinase-like family protein [Coprococcus sp.]
MAGNKIITIGRQFGSGGRQIGEALAKRMDVPFYDKQLLKEAAKESGICEEIFDSFDEKPTNSFLYSLVMDPYSLGFGGSTELPLNHKVFLAAFDTIKSLAEKNGSCVFVGRCADYALRDMDNVVNVFIYGDLEDRAKRVAEDKGITEYRAKDLIKKEDKSRASYYNYYTSKRWGDMKGYDICINTSRYGIEKTTDILYDIICNY